MDLFDLRTLEKFSLNFVVNSSLTISTMESLILRIPDEPLCYVMQAVLCINCLGDKCLLHAKLMSTALIQLLVFRFSYLLTNKGIA